MKTQTELRGLALLQDALRASGLYLVLKAREQDIDDDAIERARLEAVEAYKLMTSFIHEVVA